jgi:copper resistance protein C
MKRALRSLLAIAVGSTLAAVASAHAFFDHAAPAVGSTVHGPPAQVKVWFSQSLEPAFSTVRVWDQRGKQIDRGDARLDPDDATVLLVSLPKLAPGTYKVTWRVLSVDTHVTEGDFTFDVAP